MPEKPNLDFDLPQELADAIFQVEISVPGKGTVTRNVRPHLSIDPDYVEYYLEMEPDAVYLFRKLKGDMRSEVEKLERTLVVRRAFLRKQIIDAIKEEGGPKLTDKTLDALVETDAELITIEAEKIIAWQQTNTLEAVVQALDMRHETLRSFYSARKSER